MIIVLLAGWNLFGGDVPRSGIGVRAGFFGIPNRILDYFVYEHPEVKGESFAFEVRSYGHKGPKSVFSGIYSLEYSKMRGEGPWRDQEGHRTLTGRGDVTQVSLTATILMNIFPSSPVHIYMGGGVGVGKISIWYEGSYVDELGTEITDDYKEDRIIPVAHIPVGIIINLKNRFEIRIEGGFKNGFYAGAGVVLNF